MGDVTFRLPEAPPEDYLRLVRWWREASRYMSAAITLGGAPQRARGRDEISDLVDFVAPETVEAEARKALAEGLPTIRPALQVDASLASRARATTRRRITWLTEMAERGAPSYGQDLEPLVAEVQARNDEVLRAAGFEAD